MCIGTNIFIPRSSAAASLIFPRALYFNSNRPSNYSREFFPVDWGIGQGRGRGRRGTRGGNFIFRRCTHSDQFNNSTFVPQNGPDIEILYHLVITSGPFRLITIFVKILTVLPFGDRIEGKQNERSYRVNSRQIHSKMNFNLFQFIFPSPKLSPTVISQYI